MLTPGNAILNRARRLERNNRLLITNGSYDMGHSWNWNCSSWTTKVILTDLNYCLAFLRFASTHPNELFLRKRNDATMYMDHWPPYTIYSIHNFLKKWLRERRTTRFSNVPNAVFRRILQNDAMLVQRVVKLYGVTILVGGRQRDDHQK